MLLELLGSIVVLLSSSLIGYILSTDCKNRPRHLRELQSMLQMFENRISFLSDILTDAFERIYSNTESETGLFFAAAADKLKSETNINAADAWESSVRENIKKTALNKEDEEILVSFGKILGSSDIEGQIKNIRLTIDQLKMQEDKAERNRKKYEGMYRSIGILGGIAVVVVLL